MQPTAALQARIDAELPGMQSITRLLSSLEVKSTSAHKPAPSLEHGEPVPVDLTRASDASSIAAHYLPLGLM